MECIKFSVSADVIVARYCYNGCNCIEISIIRIQNGREEELFYSDNLEDYDDFQVVIEEWKKKGFQQKRDCDYVA
ncbi:MAG: hypothetical protein HFJ45_02270 [Clostridia bacterium]|nr:hypothetical protein [Clostridia bacterium]